MKHTHIEIAPGAMANMDPKASPETRDALRAMAAAHFKATREQRRVGKYIYSVPINTSNFPCPNAGRYIVQGTDAGTFLDSIWSAETLAEAQRIADERKVAQGGQWRVVLNKHRRSAEVRP